eukprot:scaffold55939_cov30-Tisochrysis_lutea.AAC.1
MELELLFLRQDHARALGHLLPHAHKALGLPQQLKNLAVKVHVQAVCSGVADNQRGLQTRFGSLYAFGPREVPESLELDDGARNLVVNLHVLLRLLRGHEHRILFELFHRLLDTAHELAGPHDIAGHRWRIAHGWWRGLLLLVEALHSLKIGGVVGEDDHELGFEVERKCVLGRRDVLERLIDEALKGRLKLVDIGVELQVVAIELIHLEIKQVIRLALEVRDNLEEARHEALETFKVVVRECGELLNRREHVDELLHAAAEQVKLSKDYVLVEVELLALGVLGERIAYGTVLLLVLAIAVDAHSQPGDQIGDLLLPERTANLDVGAAVGDHLLRHLAEKSCHTLSGIVIAGNGVHHLDVVEKAGQ